MWHRRRLERLFACVPLGGQKNAADLRPAKDHARVASVQGPEKVRRMLLMRRASKIRQTSLALCLALCFADAAVSSRGGGGSRAPQGDGLPPEFGFLIRGSIPSGGLEAAWAALPFDSITLERTPCFGRCPAYKVTFFRATPRSDGANTYADRFGRAELVSTLLGTNDEYVRQFPEALGRFTGWVDIWTFAQLSLLIRNADIARLPDGRPGQSDAPTTLVSVTGRLTKTVSGSGPREIQLWAIQEAIDSAAKSVAWKRQ